MTVDGVLEWSSSGGAATALVELAVGALLAPYRLQSTATASLTR